MLRINLTWPPESPVIPTTTTRETPAESESHVNPNSMNHNQPPADTTTTQVETQIKSTNDHNNTRTQQINPNTDTNLDHKMNNRRVKTEINDTEAISTSSKKIKQTIKKNNEWKSNIPESSPFTRNKWTNLTIPHPNPLKPKNKPNSPDHQR